MRTSRSPLLAALGAALLAACGATEAASPEQTLPETRSTVGGVGVVPDTVAGDRRPITVIPPPVDEEGNVVQLIGERVEGNRFLAIGDSIFAGTSSRYGGQMCDVLVPLGWEVAVEAEPSRHVEFGNRVLDEKLNPFVVEDWDVAAVFLGSNYRGDPAFYEEELREILDRLAPRETLLITVSLYRDEYAEVNEVINRIGPEYEHVTLLDWTSVAETPGILSGDRLHPSDEGRRVLVEMVAGALGPGYGEGNCLGSDFQDDSGITGSIGGGSGGSGSSSSGSGSSSGSSGGSSGGSSATTPTAPAGTIADPVTSVGGDTGSGGGDTGGGDTGGSDGGDTGGGDSGGSDGGDTGGGDSGGSDGGDTGGGDSGGSDGGDTGGGDSGGSDGGDTGGGDSGGSDGGDTGGGDSGGSDGGDTGGGDSGGSGGGDTGGSGGGDSTGGSTP